MFVRFETLPDQTCNSVKCWSQALPLERVSYLPQATQADWKLFPHLSPLLKQTALITPAKTSHPTQLRADIQFA